MAETKGLEPLRGYHPHRFSRPAPYQLGYVSSESELYHYYSEKYTKKSDCKPDSVCNDHLSEIFVTKYLKHPTRKGFVG